MKFIRTALVVGATAVALTASAAPAYALPSTTDSWAATFKALPIFGDGMVSCALGSDRRAFVTGDATPRDGSAWAHSSITMVRGNVAHVVRPNYPNTPSPYQVIPGEVTSWHWLGPCAVSSGRLYVLAPKVAQSTAWPYFTSVGHDLAVFRFTATTDPVFERIMPLPATAGVSWSAGLTISGGYLQAFGSSDVATDGWTGHDVYTMRAPLTAPTAWTFLGPTGYGPAANRAPVLSAPRDGGTETSYSVAREGTLWKLTSRLGGAWGSGAVAEWTTPALGKPWTRKTIATVPDGAYIVWKHYGVLLSDGRVPLTYNMAGFDATWTSVSAI